MSVNSQTIIEFAKIIVLKTLKVAFAAVVVTVFTIYLMRFLGYAASYLLGLFLDWQGITLTHDERYFIYLLSDYGRFYGGVVLIIFLLVFPKVRKKFLFI